MCMRNIQRVFIGSAMVEIFAIFVRVKLVEP